MLDISYNGLREIIAIAAAGFIAVEVSEVAKQKLDFTISAMLPGRSGTGEARERRERVLGETVRVFQHLVDDLSVEELETFSRTVEEAFASGAGEVREVAPEKREIVEEITGGRRWSAEERAAIEARTLLDSFGHRRELLRGSLTAPEVARALGTSRQTPHDRVKSGMLLGVRDRGALRFPAWQFDPEGPYGVLEGLPEVLRELRGSPLARVNWFVNKNSYLGMRRPLDVLREGKIGRVIRAARAAGMS